MSITRHPHYPNYKKNQKQKLQMEKCRPKMWKMGIGRPRKLSREVVTHFAKCTLLPHFQDAINESRIATLNNSVDPHSKCQCQTRLQKLSYSHHAGDWERRRRPTMMAEYTKTVWAQKCVSKDRNLPDMHNNWKIHLEKNEKETSSEDVDLSNLKQRYVELSNIKKCPSFFYPLFLTIALTYIFWG